MSKQLGIALALLVCYLSACASSKTGANTQQSTTSVQTVAVTMEVVTLGPSPTPVICTSLPKGMTLSVKPISSTSLQFEITGLQAGESLIIILRAQSDGNILQWEERPVLTADPDGRFAYVVEGFAPPPPNTIKHWMIQVVHSRGVACTEVDLP